MRIPKSFGYVSHALFRSRKWIILTLSTGVLAFVLLLLVCTYLYVVHGGMIARQSPPALETFIAHRLVDWSIPSDAKAMRDPLSDRADGGDVAAGRELYQKNCEVCHGYDGSGKTASGGGLYPPPANLRGPATIARTDGALFYLIRNGIRNTGMPGWQLTDQQTWQLVVYIRNLPKAAPTTSLRQVQGTAAHYVGSVACRGCHQTIYDHWKTTLMANVVRDPREHPNAIIPDLSKPNPL